MLILKIGYFEINKKVKFIPMPFDNIDKIPKFLKKLYREVSDPENTSIIWNNEGDHIVINNKKMFLDQTLPKLSKTREYSAFIRQLNMYGFVKVKNEKQDIEKYAHVYFKKDQPNLIAYIKRIHKFNKPERTIDFVNLENTLNYLTSSNYRMSKEIEMLNEKINKQDNTINGIISILGKVFQTGLQNISIDSQYKGQDIHSFFKYSHSPPLEPKKKKDNDFNIFKGLLPDKSKKNVNEKDIPDMSDIFF